MGGKSLTLCEMAPLIQNQTFCFLPPSIGAFVLFSQLLVRQNMSRDLLLYQGWLQPQPAIVLLQTLYVLQSFNMEFNLFASAFCVVVDFNTDIA